MSVTRTFPLELLWQTVDPFLFCAHHVDRYPPGTEGLAPAAPLTGRRLGMDFAGKDGWNMYHGQVVPGFPQHPHRGFETVTLVRGGVVDHADSLGARGRFGAGDVQWMTAGRGVVHSEMFPLLQRERGNPLEIFQIWLNLPRASKMVDPHYRMLWAEDIPTRRFVDEEGRSTEVTVVAGALDGVAPPAPPPRSWAADSGHDVAIWTLKMEPGASWTLPPARPGTQRTLYLFDGGGVRIGDRELSSGLGVGLEPEVPVPLRAGAEGVDAVLLQGQPIGEPVAHHGPFVMNRPEELREAFLDYQRGGFGGWPWDRDDPVHGPGEGRFAQHDDGRIERRAALPRPPQDPGAGGR